MSAENEFGDLEGLLGSTPPAKKAAAKKAPAKKAEAPEPEVNLVEAEEIGTDEPEETSETFQEPGDRPAWSPESLEEIRAEIKAEVLAELKMSRLQENNRAQLALNKAIETKHKGSLEPGGDIGNPLAPPEPDEDLDLPELIHFVDDGFTIGTEVTYRGQEYVPTKYDSWAALSTQEQIMRYGRIRFRVGPWEGLPFDLNDPALTEEDRIKLENVMRDRFAQRIGAGRAS